MQAVVISKFGGPEGLACIEVPAPVPGPKEVGIQVRAISVGFQDAMIRRGALSAYGFQVGHILGGEVAGLVVAVGSEVSSEWLGRTVWVMVGLGGGYAEQVVAPVSSLVPLPESVDPLQAIAIGGAGIVAHFGLLHARFTQGESVLIRGAAGPIGIMAIQLARRGGAAVIAATTSSEERGDRLRQLGATHILDRSAAATSNSPGGFDVIFDLVAGSELHSLFGKLNRNGRLVSAGAVGGFPPDDFAKGMFPAFQKSLSFATFSANSVPEPERLALVAKLFVGVSTAEYESVLQESFALRNARQAHELLETGGAFGRIALVPDV